MIGVKNDVDGRSMGLPPTTGPEYLIIASFRRKFEMLIATIKFLNVQRVGLSRNLRMALSH